MPFFDLRREQDHLDPLAYYKTLAIMLHPNDLRARERMLSRVQHRTREGPGRRRAFSDEESRRFVLQSSSSAAVAGGLLLTRLQLQLNGYKPSFNKARPLVLSLLPMWEQATSADWSRDAHIGHRPRSRQRMLVAWKEFRPVAHLWAAMIHGLQHNRADIWPAPLHQLPGFLAYADCFLSLACALPSHEPNRRFAVVASEAWRFGLPDGMIRIVKLEALPFTTEQQQILNEP